MFQTKTGTCTRCVRVREFLWRNFLRKESETARGERTLTRQGDLYARVCWVRELITDLLHGGGIGRRQAATRTGALS
jgi:hypothetical protein